MPTLAALLLLAAGLVAAATPRNQLARPSTSPTTTASFTDNEMQCYAQEKVLYSDGRCYTLRQQGPCLEGEWIVLDEPRDIGSNKPRVVCKRRSCPTAARPIYWPEDGQCHKMSDKKTLCPRKGNELRSDSYGEGECTCEKTFARFEPDVVRGRNTSAEWEGDCYPLFRRGPCPVRKLLVPATLEGFGLVARCYDDFCHRQNTADSGAAYVLHRADNTCYKLGTTGKPCREDESFNVHPMTKKVQCIGRVNSVFTGGVARCGGKGNINSLTGECREEVFLRAQTFGREVSRRKRERRRSRFEK